MTVRAGFGADSTSGYIIFITIKMHTKMNIQTVVTEVESEKKESVGYPDSCFIEYLK